MRELPPRLIHRQRRQRKNVGHRWLAREVNLASGTFHLCNQSGPGDPCLGVSIPLEYPSGPFPRELQVL